MNLGEKLDAFLEHVSEEDADQYLEHYGVLGMKWGVRKDPQKAYSKAMKKLRKLDTKKEKLAIKSDKIAVKAAKKAYKSETKFSAKGRAKAYTKYLKLNRKSAKKLYKSDKYRKKAKKWVNAMNVAFAGEKVSNIPAADIALGRSYCLELMSYAGNEPYENIKK